MTHIAEHTGSYYAASVNHTTDFPTLRDRIDQVWKAGVRVV